MKILGIETSCDETAAAVVENGSDILSSVVATQVEVHHRFGGVVPELASRKHIEAIAPVVAQALEKAGLDAGDIDGVAATRGPGLVGALLVGFCFARAWAYARQIPWVGVNHLEGHLNSVFLSGPCPDFPFVALLASGGHTSIYQVFSHTKAQCLGQTRDDAAGEAFDKVAKMLGLGYPGGAVISRLASRGDSEKYRFPRAYLDKDSYDFSFSGLKTAVRRHIETHDDYHDHLADIAAGFQAAAVDVMADKLILAAKTHGCKNIAIVGGVAANQYLRARVADLAREYQINLFVPEVEFCGDNGAMIAALGYHLLNDPAAGFGGLEDDVFSRITSI
jgi:N6-L-threonylcarbamoyladenine synthase